MCVRARAGKHNVPLCWHGVHNVFYQRNFFHHQGRNLAWKKAFYGGCQPLHPWAISRALDLLCTSSYYDKTQLYTLEEIQTTSLCVLHYVTTCKCIFVFFSSFFSPNCTNSAVSSDYITVVTNSEQSQSPTVKRKLYLYQWLLLSTTHHLIYSAFLTIWMAVGFKPAPRCATRVQYLSGLLSFIKPQRAM